MSIKNQINQIVEDFEQKDLSADEIIGRIKNIDLGIIDKLARAISALEDLEATFIRSQNDSHTKAERCPDKASWVNGYYQGNGSGFKLAAQWTREVIDFEINQPIRVEIPKDKAPTYEQMQPGIVPDPEERCPKCGNRNRLCICWHPDHQ